MDQLNIFDFLGVSNDPLFIKLGSLDNEHKLILDFNDQNIQIEKNTYGIYELKSTNIHEPFLKLIDVYKFIVHMGEKYYE